MNGSTTHKVEKWNARFTPEEQAEDKKRLAILEMIIALSLGRNVLSCFRRLEEVGATVNDVEAEFALMHDPRQQKEWSSEASSDLTPRKAKVPIPDELRWAVLERDNFTCHYCGSRKFLAADHRISESRGGETVLENLVTACKDCNSRKGKRNHDEYCQSC